MAWVPADDDVRVAITEGLAPPSSLDGALGDEFWVGVFSMWCTDTGFQSGDYEASMLFSLWRDYAYGTPWEQVHANYVDPQGPMAIAWPQSVHDTFARAQAGMEDGAGAMQELWQQAVEKLEPHFDAFLADINELQSEVVGTVQAVGLTRDRIDMAVVDSLNEAALKGIGEGEFVDYLMAGDVLLLGDAHPQAYVDYVNNHADGGTGRIFMEAKGSFGSRGELLCQGHGTYHERFDTFKAALRRVTQKKITISTW